MNNKHLTRLCLLRNNGNRRENKMPHKLKGDEVDLQSYATDIETSVSLKTIAFRDIAPCSLVEVD
jgi:hypothetical protein